jgi:hypothetical protein
MYTDRFGRTFRYGPPAGWIEPPSGVQINFNNDTEWAALVERGIHFSEYKGPSSVRRVRGDCLEPLITNQHRLHVQPVAPDETLIDGGLYIIDHNNEGEVQAYREHMGIKSKDPILIAKFLRWVGYEWYTQCKDSIASLDGQVIAKVVAVLPLVSGSLIESEVHARQAARCGQLGNNAASSMVSNSSAPAVNTNNNVTQGAGSSTDTNVITAAVTTFGYPMAIDVGCTVTLTGGGSPGSSFTSGVLDVFMDGTSIGSAKWDGTNLANYGGGSTPPAIQVTLSATNTPTAGAHTYALHAHVAGSGTAWSCTMSCVNNFIKVREIKR